MEHHLSTHGVSQRNNVRTWDMSLPKKRLKWEFWLLQRTIIPQFQGSKFSDRGRGKAEGGGGRL
jgi:hypothetical protein